MLSSRQKWRHQSLVGIRRKEHDFLYAQGLDNITVQAIRVFPKSASESSISDVAKPIMGSKKYATTGSLIDAKNISLVRTKVRFNTAIRVILIPTVSEYRQAGLGDLMWWDESHYKEFKMSAITELKLHMLHHPGLDSKSAIKDMYQPSERDNDTPSPSKSVDNNPSTSEKSMSSRRNSGRISADLLSNMDGLLVKSRAKNIKFEKSIFKPTEEVAGPISSTNKDAPVASGPLGIGSMGLMLSNLG